VQNQLGHKDASITLNVYASLWPDKPDDVLDVMDATRTEVLESKAK
jgi:integrase